MTRSPWTGLTSAQLLELEDAEKRPDRAGRPFPEVMREVGDEYARRTVVALVAGDLYGALHVAGIAFRAHAEAGPAVGPASARGLAAAAERAGVAVEVAEHL